MRSHLKNKGFTLAEVLVATTIASFIAIVALGALQTITKSAATLDYMTSANEELGFAIQMVSEDLANLYRDPNIAETLLVTSIDEYSSSDSSILTMYTVNRNHARIDLPECDVYEVEYFVQETEDEDSILYKRVWPNPNKYYEPGGILIPIAEHIIFFEVSFFDGEKWNFDWYDDYGVLPEMIQINIVAQDPKRGIPISEKIMTNIVRFPTEDNMPPSTDQSGNNQQDQTNGGSQQQQQQQQTQQQQTQQQQTQQQQQPGQGG